MRSIALALMLLAAPAFAGGPKTDGPAVGAAAPDFTLVDHTGKSHTLSKYKGKVVVLEWTNKGCPFVARHYEKKTMAGLYKTFGDKVVWLAIDSTHFAKPEENAAWAAKEGIEYPILGDASGAVGHSYGARATPEMYVVGADGKIAYRGAIDDDPFGDKTLVRNYVSGALTAVLAGTAPNPARVKAYGCTIKYASN